MNIPQRIAVAGTSGVGKTTLCRQLEDLLGYPRAELDALFLGENWTPRPSFLREVEDFITGEQWICEYQYPQARPLIAARADTLVWLDFKFSVQMARLIKRTVFRSLSKKPLWNNNVEQPLHTIVKDPDDILGWAWRSRNDLKKSVPQLQQGFPHLTIVHLKSPGEVKLWIQKISS